MTALGVPELGRIAKHPQKTGPSASPGYLQAVGVWPQEVNAFQTVSSPVE